MKKVSSVIFCLVVCAQVSLAKQAPSFRGELLGGGRAALNDYLKPNRALLLCFWATWCIPCLQELKMVKDHLAANPSVALDVVTVNVDASETSSDVKPTFKQHGHTFPVIMDPKHEIFSKFHSEKTLPFSVLINHRGEIVEQFNGYHEEMFAKVEKAIGGAKVNAMP